MIRWPIVSRWRGFRSPPTRDQTVSLSSRGVAEERLCILHVGAKIWEQMPSREEARRRLGLPQEAPVIMSVSRFTAERDEPKERKT